MRLFEPISKEFSEIAGNRANIGKNTSFTDFSELLLFLQSIIGHIRVGQAFSRFIEMKVHIHDIWDYWRDADQIDF